MNKTKTYEVLVVDMFHEYDEPPSVVAGFPTVEAAREYARRRTRDSLEELRSHASSPKDLEDAWYLNGEDCSVVGDDYSGYKEIGSFIANPATAEERDWVALEKTNKTTSPRSRNFPRP